MTQLDNTLTGNEPRRTIAQGHPKNSGAKLAIDRIEEMVKFEKDNTGPVACCERNISERLMDIYSIYHDVPPVVAKVVWAHGELGLTNAVPFILGLLDENGKQENGREELREEVIEALGKLDSRGESIHRLLKVAANGNAGEGCRAKASVAAEKIASRISSDAVERVQKELQRHGVRVPRDEKGMPRLPSPRNGSGKAPLQVK